MDWLRDILIAALETDSSTESIVIRSFVGLALVALCGGLAYLLAKFGDGGGSFMDSVGQGFGAFLASLGGFGEGVKIVAAGVADFLRTLKTAVEKAAEVRIAEINAAKEVTDIQLGDGKGRTIAVKMTGNGANRAASNVLDSLRGTSRDVMGGTAVRVLTDNRSQQQGNEDE